MVGTSDGFSRESSTNRAMIVAIFYRFEGELNVIQGEYIVM